LDGFLTLLFVSIAMAEMTFRGALGPLKNAEKVASATAQAGQVLNVYP
jgi:hypothetical protein